jgi:phosphoglycerate dehydrogenase-like enzyme
MAEAGRVTVAVWGYDGLEAVLFDDEQRSRLERLADVVSWSVARDRQQPGFEAALERVEVLLTAWGCPLLDEEVLASLPSLRLVAHAAGTVKDFATPALWNRGIAVTSAAAANALPVAEYTVAMLLLSGKDAFRRRDRYRDGVTDDLWFGTVEPVGNRGRRVGIIGASLIGRRVIELLAPFDLELAVSDPYLTAEEADRLGVRKLELDDLFSWSDVVSIHAPDLPTTRGMVGREQLARLRDGGTIINTARGALVDHAALEAEVCAGRLTAILDVTDPEPYPADSPLWSSPNAVITPHLAGAQGNELPRLVALALDEIERFVAGDGLRYAVQQADLDRIA